MRNSFLKPMQTVLFEQETDDGLAEGYTERYLRVRAAGMPGTLQNVLLKSIKMVYCMEKS